MGSNSISNLLKGYIIFAIVCMDETCEFRVKLADDSVGNLKLADDSVANLNLVLEKWGDGGVNVKTESNLLDFAYDLHSYEVCSTLGIVHALNNWYERVFGHRQSVNLLHKYINE